MREISIKFKGVTYTISENRAFQIGEQVEEIISLRDIATWQEKPRMFKLARAIGAMLRFAGAKAKDQEVLDELTTGDDASGAQSNATEAMSSLISLLTNGAQGGGGGDELPEKTIAS